MSTFFRGDYRITEVYCTIPIASHHAMLYSIQSLRALAAWLVVLHHYIQVVHNNNTNDPMSNALHMYGSIGVDLFFIISGFVIYISATGKNVTSGVFAAHRIARVIPAYWIFTLISAVVLIYSPAFLPRTQFEPLFLLKSLLFIPAQNPSGASLLPLITVGWTLNYEMAFYCIFLLSFYLPKKIQLLTISLGLLFLCKVVPLFGGDLIFYGNKIVFEFLLGILIACAYQKKMIQRITIATSIALLLMAIMMIIYFGPVSHSIIKSGIPCAIIVLVAIGLERFFPKSGILKNLGDWSYSTYLCHVLVMCFMMHIQQTLNLNSVVTFVLIIAGILIVSYASFTLIEKPIAKFAKKYFSGATPSPVPVS